MTRGRTCRRVPPQVAGTQTNMHATLSSSPSHPSCSISRPSSPSCICLSFGWLQAVKLARDCELQQGASSLSLAAVQAQGCFCFLALLSNARTQAQVSDTCPSSAF
uniref:Uncharacterized protein n=1 Tax=Aegilops tauschii subsp. strangulata TaxID=200361 RepID=A0A452YQQ8_AEGTS